MLTERQKQVYSEIVIELRDEINRRLNPDWYYVGVTSYSDTHVWFVVHELPSLEIKNYATGHCTYAQFNYEWLLKNKYFLLDT